MEIFLYLVIIILLIVNNAKIKTLTKNIKFLEQKIDTLKHLYYKKKTEEIFPKKSIKKESFTETKPKIIPKIKEKAPALSDKIVEVTTLKKEKPQTEEKVFQKEKTPHKTIGEKLREKLEKFKKNNPDLEKFIGENLISKIGILILVLGISFFVKYAIDKEWINEVSRVGIGFLAGGILLGFAHVLQKNYKAFSSILVSGAITVFYFIITYAFKEYELFSQTITFILLVVITIFSVAISILYDRKELGVLSIIGGFAVPILTSNGSGNFTVLFSYLLILNIGFLFMSIKKKWFVVNILTFVFTHLFFFGWLLKDNSLNVNSASLFVFASLFYFIFYLMNIFRIIKEKEYVMKPIVMSLFLISTFVFFGQGLYLLNYLAPSLKGGFTLLLAVINLVSGWLLLKNKIIDVKTVYLFIGMTLTFLTLAGPIQLEGNYITLFWAAESTLLIWLSQKINNNDFKISAFITIILMTASLFMDFEHVYYSSDPINILFNKGFITGIFSVITLLLSALLFNKEKENYLIANFNMNPSKIKIVLLILAGVILYITGLLELTHQVQSHFDFYLSSIITVIYNYIFIIIGIYFSLKSKNEQIYIIGLVVSLITLFFSIQYLNNIPFKAFLYSKTEMVSNPTFYIQFILFIATLYIIKLLYNYINNSKNNYTAIKYVIAIIFVTLVSIEVLLISQPILINNVLENTEILSIVNSSKIAVIKTSFPVLWGVLAFVFLFFGIKNNKKEWRVFALVLIAVTIVKLFTYDIGNVSQGGKIVSFIILGILLLVISFMYQKIKKLFNDEDNKE